MKCVFVFFVVLTVLCSFTWSQSCQTPIGVASQCISLYDCPPLLTAFEQQPLPAQFISFLKQSQCGFDGFTPKVCCGPLPNRRPVTQTSTTTNRPIWPSNPSSGNQNDNKEDDDSSPAPDGQCGEDHQDRIYGGQITDLDEFPWMALIGYRTRSDSLTYQCGGVLLNHRYVLTAAHCVTGAIEREVGKLATVRLGEYDTQQDVDCLDGTCADRPQEIPVAGSYPHAGFSDRNLNRQDDVALVKLARRARYNDYVHPICMIDTSARLEEGNSVYVAGWGKTLNGRNSPVKLKLGMPIYSKSKCNEKYRPVRVTLTDKQICAGGSFAQDTCKGDSGGPLMRKRRQGVWEVVGIVSFGNGCGKDGWPGVYTSVAGYEDWIRSTMASTNV